MTNTMEQNLPEHESGYTAYLPVNNVKGLGSERIREDFKKFETHWLCQSDDDSSHAINSSVQILVDACYHQSAAMGWWDTPRNTGEAIALMHSELSEALEGARKGGVSYNIPEFSLVEEELADAIIHICDFAGGAGLDIAGALVTKLFYNQTREDHKKENREAGVGKTF